MFYHTFVNVSL